MRDDGLFDVEAHIVDTKTYPIEEPYRGLRAPGLHVHDMQLRITLDRELIVREIEVTTNDAPYPTCYTVAEAYKKLVGAKIGGGWRRAVNEAVGGTQGCTHLKAITARSNDLSVRFHRAMGFEATGEGEEDGLPVVLDYGGPGVHRAVFRRAL